MDQDKLTQPMSLKLGLYAFDINSDRGGKLKLNSQFPCSKCEIDLVSVTGAFRAKMAPKLHFKKSTDRIKKRATDIVIKQTLTKLYKTFKSFESIKNVHSCHRGDLIMSH